MRIVAERTGFRGSTAEWIAEYEGLCSEFGIDMDCGVNHKTFARLVDDTTDRGCFCADEELRDIALRGESVESSSSGRELPLWQPPPQQPPPPAADGYDWGSVRTVAAAASAKREKQPAAAAAEKKRGTREKSRSELDTMWRSDSGVKECCDSGSSKAPMVRIQGNLGVGEHMKGFMPMDLEGCWTSNVGQEIEVYGSNSACSRCTASFQQFDKHWKCLITVDQLENELIVACGPFKLIGATLNKDSKDTVDSITWASTANGKRTTRQWTRKGKASRSDGE